MSDLSLGSSGAGGSGAPALLITTLARYQTGFWIAVARKLQSLGYPIAFLAFDDPSHAWISGSGLKSFNAFDLAEQSQPPSPGALEEELARRLGWSLPLAVSHERITYGLGDTAALARKLGRHRAAAAAALAEMGHDRRRVVVVQELGGFLSVIGTFLAARAAGCDNLFLEPAFFKGRFFATRNTFAAPRIERGEGDSTVELAALQQLDLARSTKAIVIPAKDRHHYTAALSKVANRANARRLAEKLYEKYARRQRHEFGYVSAHVRNHLRMVANSWRLRRVYSNLPAGAPMVYYPLHVPADVALTLRAPQYLDQLSLVDYLARTMPSSHRLAIKEHPAQVGALDARRLNELVRRHDNLVLLPPSTNNYEVMDRCRLVISINSKAGAEALLLDRQVLVLGDAFYADSGLVTKVNALAEVPAAIRRMLASPARIDAAHTAQFFSRVWRATHPGELYVADPANTDVFGRSLDAALRAEVGTSSSSTVFG